MHFLVRYIKLVQTKRKMEQEPDSICGVFISLVNQNAENYWLTICLVYNYFGL